MVAGCDDHVRKRPDSARPIAHTGKMKWPDGRIFADRRLDDENPSAEMLAAGVGIGEPRLRRLFEAPLSGSRFCVATEPCGDRRCHG